MFSERFSYGDSENAIIFFWIFHRSVCPAVFCHSVRLSLCPFVTLSLDSNTSGSITIFLNLFWFVETLTKWTLIMSQYQWYTNYSIDSIFDNFLKAYHRCDCNLWSAPWLYCVFFWVFSYIIDEHSCLKYCIYTKLSQIMCLINVHILVCQLAKYDCWLWKVLSFNCIFWDYFIYYYTFKTI